MKDIYKTLAILNIHNFSLAYIPKSSAEFADAFTMNIFDDSGNHTVVNSVEGITWEDIVAADKLRNLRKERDKKLKECDWITLKAYSRGEVVTSDWATYQQELRDITKTYNSLQELNGNWPTKPE